jgi:hypothetical protein
MQPCHHRCLHRRHHLTGGGPDHGEAEDAVVILTDKSFHEALSLIVGNTCFAPAPICA